MSEPTPGPWFTGPEVGNTQYGVFACPSDIKIICYTALNTHSRTPRARANALLIAAAPTMKAALLDCIAALERDHADSADHRRASAINARAAIAEAEGRR